MLSFLYKTQQIITSLIIKLIFRNKDESGIINLNMELSRQVNYFPLAKLPLVN